LDHRDPAVRASNIFHIIDKLLVDGLVERRRRRPAGSEAMRPSQTGVLQGYALRMAPARWLVVSRS
jgi:hypothetical protein